MSAAEHVHMESRIAAVSAGLPTALSPWGRIGAWTGPVAMATIAGFVAVGAWRMQQRPVKPAPLLPVVVDVTPARPEAAWVPAPVPVIVPRPVARRSPLVATPPAAPVAAERVAAPAVPVASTEDPLQREAALLSQAQRVLASHPARALSLCDQHRDEFASGQLAAEREVMAVDALLRLGRADEAVARGQRVTRHDPTGLYAERIAHLLKSPAPGSAQTP